MAEDLFAMLHYDKESLIRLHHKSWLGSDAVRLFLQAHSALTRDLLEAGEEIQPHELRDLYQYKEILEGRD
jgi:hypothetical protein